MEYILGMMRGNGMYPRNDQGKLEMKCLKWEIVYYARMMKLN